MSPSAALGAGLLTGWAVAMPLGPVGAALLMFAARGRAARGATRIRWRPPPSAVAAALGVATTDGGYALAGALGGVGLFHALSGIRVLLRLAGAAVLIVLAGRGVARAVAEARGQPSGQSGAIMPGVGRAFLRMLALTAANPVTVLAFAALAAAGPGRHSVDEALPFTGGVLLASGAWQLLLVAVGAAAGGRLATPLGRLTLGVGGNLIIAIFAIRLAC